MSPQRLRSHPTQTAVARAPAGPSSGTLIDPVTGLANEHLLLGTLARLNRSTSVGPAARPALVTLEIDRLGQVSSCFGPAAERSALERLARRLRTLTPPEGLLGRTGPRQFTYLLPVAEPETARLLALDVERALLRPISAQSYAVLPAPRIGIAAATGSVTNGRQLLDAARLAADQPQSAGASGATVFTTDLARETIDRMQLQAELSLALDSDQLRLEYQPIISIETGKVTGFKALLRWDHPVHGTISPDDVIPLAEETGLIGPIGDWILAEASRQMAAWKEQFAEAAELTLNVNISSHHLGQPDLVHRILKLLQSTGLPPDALRLELTEEMIVSGPDTTARLEELQRHGIEIQLDDFGSGYSSLGQLSHLPVDSLKLDRVFLERCESDPRSATILKSLVALARELGLAVTAGGIETPEQAKRIRALACEAGLGYFYHQPLDEEAAEQLLVA